MLQVLECLEAHPHKSQVLVLVAPKFWHPLNTCGLWDLSPVASLRLLGSVMRGVLTVLITERELE